MLWNGRTCFWKRRTVEHRDNRLMEKPPHTSRWFVGALEKGLDREHSKQPDCFLLSSSSHVMNPLIRADRNQSSACLSSVFEFQWRAVCRSWSFSIMTWKWSSIKLKHTDNFWWNVWSNFWSYRWRWVGGAGYFSLSLQALSTLTSWWRWMEAGQCLIDQY